MNHTNQTGRQLAITGFVLQLCALGTLIFTVVGILREFDKMSAASDVSGLATGISANLTPMAAGSVVGLIGLILISIALLSLRYRAQWFRTMLWLLAILWLPVFPVGTALGIVVIFYLVKHKDEFKTPAAGAVRRPV
jgi:biopolymer transport protein ExbB/TolQ